MEKDMKEALPGTEGLDFDSSATVPGPTSTFKKARAGAARNASSTSNFAFTFACPASSTAHGPASLGGQSQSTPPPSAMLNNKEPSCSSPFNFNFTFSTTGTNNGPSRDEPPSQPSPQSPLFDEERRPYGFNWNDGGPEGKGHPGSVSYNPARNARPHHTDHRRREHRGSTKCEGAPPSEAPESRSRYEGFNSGARGTFGRGRDGHQKYSAHGPGRCNHSNRPSPSNSTGNGPKPAPPPRSAPPPKPKESTAPRYHEAFRASVPGVDIAKAWEIYSAQWRKLTSPPPNHTTIKVSEIPWPLIVNTSKMRYLSEISDKITTVSVGDFILSSKHSAGVANKKRIHQALRLYHPDRFEVAVVAKVAEKEKRAVRELGEIVAKCLNTLLEREN
ncbi:hypothetical protein FRB90_006886 [Tulasnella sp. 427]|nr:hypothetical protein FRB90_006886 [Tulasnella sp. 427]